MYTDVFWNGKIILGNDRWYGGKSNFQKLGGGEGELHKISVFRGGLQFLHKKIKLKSEIFNEKKVYKQKCFSLS